MRTSQATTCSRCGILHEPRKYPTYKQRCQHFKSTRHFVRDCQSKNKSCDTCNTNQLDSSRYDPTDIDDLVLALTDMGVRRIYSPLEVEGKTVTFLLDCDSTVKSLPHDLPMSLQQILPVRENSAKLRMFNGQSLSTIGVTNGNVKYPESKQAQKLDFHAKL